jgi:proteasome assembly chaperone (PAC2) family protein
MNKLIELWEHPAAAAHMIAGWHQWADAGAVSSGFPQYLIEQTRATRIGEMKPDGFYLFQVPGTHDLLRPVVRLSEGYREKYQHRRNEIFYSGDDGKGFLIFLGEEPHQNEERYAEAFFDAVEELGVKRVAAVAGVYGPVPYDKDRDVSCVYSLLGMKAELSRYAVRFSDYEGGVTISTYLADRAESRGIEFFTFYAFVPSYDFSRLSSKLPIAVQAVAIGEDFKAWYDLMRRLNHMFDLDMDLSDLERRSDELIAAWDSKIDHVAKTMPELGVRDYIEEVNQDFTETPFEPLSDVWEEALRDLFEDL